jgi:Secretion system C-terminal sorting domain
MKRIPSLLSLALAIINAQEGSAQIIPNGNFENWTFVGAINTPDNWQGSVLQPCDPVSPIQTLDAVDGNYAILFETINCGGGLGVNGGNASVSFPTSENPAYLNGYYKSERSGEGMAEVRVRVTNNFIEIGGGFLQINSSVSSYTAFSIPITYTSELTADHVGIWLSSDVLSFKTLGNKLWIDNLSLSLTPLSTPDIEEARSVVSIYPNPAQDQLFVDVKNEAIGAIKILDVFGQIVAQKNAEIGTTVFDVRHLHQGIYFIHYPWNGTSNATKWIKQ